MPKYINADELIEKYLDEENYFPTDDYFEGYIDGIIFCHRMVDDMPSADVVEVKHGHWVTVYPDGLDMVDYHICSLCGHKTFEHRPNFCSNCGADMRERKDEE